ncbi:uncharacterized protein B0J16DRAFT_398781 [Fusarium flagelliforme]|uniref:uncharacterized protein n=1 Tax=Fusarium flagelliforme TaxID=2675880 RepID=UPI001E8D60D3|nr:uncharacterized protein B0J16DRAFT_398781 [Fusarium flagelliforme]KAH7185107.1 hypothetical protein B0J16DRAFT_398781 [Fusarium flagelliforme]
MPPTPAFSMPLQRIESWVPASQEEEVQTLDFACGEGPSISSMLASCFVTTGRSILLQPPSTTGRLFLSTLDNRVLTMSIGVRLSESRGPVIGIHANTGVATRRLSCGIRSSPMISFVPFSVTSAPSPPPTISSLRFTKPLCTVARRPSSAECGRGFGQENTRDTNVTEMHDVATIPCCSLVRSTASPKRSASSGLGPQEKVQWLNTLLGLDALSLGKLV